MHEDDCVLRLEGGPTAQVEISCQQNTSTERVRKMWIVYSVGPIDHGWENLKTVRQTLSEIMNSEDDFLEKYDIPTESIDSFLKRWESAKEAARRHGWEGDFRHEPYVFWLPSEVDFVYGFVFKQDNNGTTFVVSPQQLPSVANIVK